MTHLRNIVRPLLLSSLALALAWASAACSSGPLDPGRRALEEKRREWVEYARSVSVYDSLYDLTDRGDVLPLTIRALPLTDPLLARARAMRAGDARFSEALDAWLEAGRLVVLVGVYSRDLKDDDLIKNGRFRFAVRAEGTLKSYAAAGTLQKETFLLDYYPVFNPWEKVVALSFPGGWDRDPVLIVEWPSGSRELRLVPAGDPGRPLPDAPAGARP